MKHVYIVLLNDILEREVFTNLTAIANRYEISRATLSKHVNKAGKYESERLKVYLCPIVKGKQKGFYR